MTESERLREDVTVAKEREERVERSFLVLQNETNAKLDAFSEQVLKLKGSLAIEEKEKVTIQGCLDAQERRLGRDLSTH